MFNKNIESYGNKEDDDVEGLVIGLPLVLLILYYVFLFMTGNNLIAYGGFVTIGCVLIWASILSNTIDSDELDN